MRAITKLATIVMLVAMTALNGTKAYAQMGELTVGADVGYVNKNETAKIGAFLQYALSSHIRIAPELSGYLRHNNTDAFVADVNVHFPMRITSKPVGLYPLVGLNFTSWSIHHPLVETLHTSKVGANVGAGFEYYFKSNMKFNVELKYTLIKDYSAFVTSVGVGYIF